MGVDLGLEPATFVVELLAEVVEEREVDANARVFHATEHANERKLDPLVELHQLARLERLLQRFDQTEEEGGAALRVFDARVAIEVEGALFPIRRGELDREVPAGEILEEILPLTRIEEIRHERGVVLERAQVDLQPARELLRPVRDKIRIGAARERFDLLADVGVASSSAST